MPDNTFKIIFAIGLGVYLFGVYGPSFQRFRRSRKVDTRLTPLDVLLDFATFAMWQVLPLVYVFTSWLEFADYRLPAWIGWIGSVVLAGAIALLWRAYADLGRNWSPRLDIEEGHILVTHGAYRHIRHPVYAGMWLWAIAQPLLLHNWIAGPGLLALYLPLYLIRVPREERMMLEHFGEEYRDYMSGTGRIFPRFRA